jgi:hypothetical protein
VIVAPLLAAVLELKTRVDSKRALYRRRRDGTKQSHLLEGAYIQGELHTFEYMYKPPLQSGPYLRLKKGGGGLFSGGYGNNICYDILY